MSDPGLTSQRLRTQHVTEFTESSSFRTFGISEQSAVDYLVSAKGTRYIQMLKEADPAASTSKLAERAINQLTSGRELPRMETIDEPLVKIVPRGEPVSPHSPFFARQSAFEDAIARGHNLSEHFALPERSEADIDAQLLGIRYRCHLALQQARIPACVKPMQGSKLNSLLD